MSTVPFMLFSDLHKNVSALDSSEALVSSIRSDITRFSKEDPQILAPEILIVCGDIVQGSVTSVEEIERQYVEANNFLTHVCNEFFGGDKTSVIIIPGNHDISWPHSRGSMEKLERYDPGFSKLLKDPRNDIRWNWEEGSYYKIVDLPCYDQRFILFSRFYSAFYENKRDYSLKPEEQFDIFEFPHRKLLFAGFNSCFRNDHLNNTGMISPDCIARCHKQISKETYDDWLKIAVWHHGIHGNPAESDFIDERAVQFLIDKGFKIGLHGHQHKSDLCDIKFNADHSQNMLILGCGTLGAAKEHVPLGEPRQYTIVEIDIGPSKVRFHVRKGIDQPQGLPIWMPGNINQNNDKSYMDAQILNNVTLLATKFPEGEEKMVEKSKSIRELATAEDFVAKKEWPKALDKLKPLDQDDPFVRRLTEECFLELNMDKEMIEYIKKPTTLTEFTYLSEALWKKGDISALRRLLCDVQTKLDIVKSPQYKRMSEKLEDKGN